jgi:hypothetical protein
VRAVGAALVLAAGCGSADAEPRARADGAASRSRTEADADGAGRVAGGRVAGGAGEVADGRVVGAGEVARADSSQRVAGGAGEVAGAGGSQRVASGAGKVAGAGGSQRVADGAGDVDPRLVDRYPSLAHYPAVGAALRGALARGDGPREVLPALAETMAPYRWPSMLDWDRHGFIAVDERPAGYVTRVDGGLVSQPDDRRDLGCAGGFLEGVRLTLLPRLAIADLDRCEPDVPAVAGAPAGCDPARDYGLRALANIARRLDAAQLPGGARLTGIDVDDAGALAGLTAPGAVHLCTVSHRSQAQAMARFHHHLMIVLGTPDGAALEVFDTTGGRGVAVMPMTPAQLARYCKTQLRANREYRYVAPGTGLTCLAVAPGGRVM